LYGNVHTTIWCKQHCILSCAVFQAVKLYFPQKYNGCLFRIIIARPLALFTLFYENENTASWGTALNPLKMFFLELLKMRFALFEKHQ